MKINFFITSLGGGGAERVVCNLSNYLSSQQHDITITVLRGNEDTYQLKKEVCLNYLQPSYYTEKKSGLYRVKEISTVFKSLKEIPQDVLLVSFLELPVAYSLFFRYFYKSKLVICERNNPLFYSKVYQWIFKRFSRRAEGVACQTKVIRDWYLPHVGSKTAVVVIPNSINKDILDANVVKERKKVILTMGRLAPQKNQKLLIDAFAELADKYPEWDIHIYGKGPLEDDIRNRIDSLGLNDRVKLFGFTKDAVGAYNTAGLFVLTSDHEGMPNVLAEAMAMGLPCISTDCGGGGAKELINNGVNGILIPKNDQSLLVESLKSLIDNPLYAERLANEAKKIRNRLDSETIHKQWELFFNSLYN